MRCAGRRERTIYCLRAYYRRNGSKSKEANVTDVTESYCQPIRRNCQGGCGYFRLRSPTFSYLLLLSFACFPALAAYRPGSSQKPEMQGEASVEMPGTEYISARHAGSAFTMLIVGIASGAAAQKDLVGNGHANTNSKGVTVAGCCLLRAG
jgi:hypothetical protein